MKIKTLYQTLKDKENPEQVLENAPYPCNWNNSWLGDGYYFWDTFIENAHWWGKIRNGNRYIICKTICDFSSNNCFDLVGDTEHMVDFSDSMEFLKSRKLITSSTTVARVLQFLKTHLHFEYEAIRVYGINSISPKSGKHHYRLNFELDRKQYLDYKPAIQICIFTKNGLNCRDLTIEYPDKYNENYVI